MSVVAEWKEEKVMSVFQCSGVDECFHRAEGKQKDGGK